MSSKEKPGTTDGDFDPHLKPERSTNEEGTRLDSVTLEKLYPHERTIDRLAEFTDPEVEHGYRESTLQRDRSLTAIGLIVGGSVAGVFILSDYRLFELSETFWTLAFMRTSLLVLTVVAVNALRTCSWRAYDAWTTAWLLAAVLLMFVVDDSRPREYLIHLVFDTAVLLAIYVFFTTRFVLQVGIALSLTFALVIVNLQKQMRPVELMVILVTLVVLNACGVLLAWRSHRMGREQFAAMLTEKELRLALEKLAFTDELTGVSNRRDFMVHAESEFARFRRHSTDVSLLMLDLDHFKQINDRFGHEVGDHALRVFASLLEENARINDLVARLGGEEFALFLPDSDLVAAGHVADRILEGTRNLQYAPEQTEQLTVSIGVTTAGKHDLSLDQLIGRADRALYSAKGLGRDRAEFE